MAIIRWNSPLAPVRNPLFDEDFFNWSDLINMDRGLNIYETDDDVIVEASIPGVPEDKVDVTVEGNVLYINAVHEETDEQKDKKKVVYKSNRHSSFSYSANLPGIVNGAEAFAEIDNGVVTVTVPKAEEKKPKKITVNRKSDTKKLNK